MEMINRIGEAIVERIVPPAELSFGLSVARDFSERELLQSAPYRKPYRGGHLAISREDRIFVIRVRLSDHGTSDQRRIQDSANDYEITAH